MAFQRFFMKTLKIILPDQLSENNPIYSDLNNDDYLMFYEPLDTFFEINHHKQKIVFLISSFRKIINNNSHKNIIHRKITKNSKENLNSFLNNINQEHKFLKIVISKPSDFDVYKNLMFFCHFWCISGQSRPAQASSGQPGQPRPVQASPGQPEEVPWGGQRAE